MIDATSLRRDLMDYYGTAKEVHPAATIDLIDVQNANLNELIAMATEAGFDLEDYMIFFDGD